MINTSMPDSADIVGKTVSRSQMEVLIKNSTKPLVFELCNFEGIDLSRLNMDGFEFKSCTFMGTSLYAASMSQTIWLRCRGSYANFEAADLVDAQFQNCDFSNTTWRRTQLSSALYKGCKLTGASFEEVEHLGLSFEETLLVAADLRRMSFRKMLLQQIDFSDADLSGCDFRDAIFMGGSLRNAHTKLARFGGADLREVDVGGLKLLDTTLFRGATISHKQAAVLLGELGLCIA